MVGDGGGTGDALALGVRAARGHGTLLPNAGLRRWAG